MSPSVFYISSHPRSSHSLTVFTSTLLPHRSIHISVLPQHVYQEKQDTIDNLDFKASHTDLTITELCGSQKWRGRVNFHEAISNSRSERSKLAICSVECQDC